MIKNIDKLKDEIKSYLEIFPNIILHGPPGTGKTYIAMEVAKEITKNNNNNIELVQFHPSYDYTDFVEGLRPVKNLDGSIGFELRDGIFMKFCKKAAKDESNDYVFIIDEINRAEISKVFGELFFSIDPDYRGKKGKVKTQYANLRNDNDPFKEGFYVPENVYIIGTMNDIDRSVESFDLAIRRRFLWKEITAEDSYNIFADEDFVDKIKKVFGEDKVSEYIEKIRKCLCCLNEKIKDTEELGENYQIGAAYITTFVKNYKRNSNNNNNMNIDKLLEDILKDIWEYRLKNLLHEYLRGTNNDVDNSVNKLLEGFKNEFIEGYKKECEKIV